MASTFFTLHVEVALNKESDLACLVNGNLSSQLLTSDHLVLWYTSEMSSSINSALEKRTKLREFQLQKPC